MEITEKLLTELQNRLKVGSRRGVHLNAITGRSRYKFDITRLSHIDENLPQNFRGRLPCIIDKLTFMPLLACSHDFSKTKMGLSVNNAMLLDADNNNLC